MGVKLTYNSTAGLSQTVGTGVDFQTDAISFNAFPTVPVQTITTSATVTKPGVYTISGSTALTVVMPLASDVPGGYFVFRNASVHAHSLTGSAETSGVKVFVGGFNISGSDGSRISTAASLNASVSLRSDGARYCLSAHNGTVTFAGI